MKNTLLLALVLAIGSLPSSWAGQALPGGGVVERDLPYGSDAQQRLDVYRPAHANGAPILFMVHGGAWMGGDKSDPPFLTNKVGHWLPKGYVLVSANYRMSAHPNPLDQADDIARAFAFVQTKAASWGGNPGRIVLLGHSAGAHLVSLLAADSRIVIHQGGSLWQGTISLDNPAFDMVQHMQREHEEFYDRVFGQDLVVWKATSPIRRLQSAPRPILAVCSSRGTDACPQARAFADKAATLGGTVTVLPVDLTHDEINEELGQAHQYTEAVEDFLQSLGLP